MKLKVLYPEGFRDVSQRECGGTEGRIGYKVNRARASLEFPCVHFPDSFGWDAESCQKVVFQFVTVWLNSKGSLHAEEPGIAFFVAYGKSFMSARNADRSIVLLKQPWPPKPTTEEVGELFA